MIEISHVTKRFGGKHVLNDISLVIPGQMIYGLIGYNGAGKTTLLKIINGIYRPDGGNVMIDGNPVYEKEEQKRKMFMMTEELYFLQQATLRDMNRFLRGYYEKWDEQVFERLTDIFGLDCRQKISGFSKGMQRQAGIITAFSAGPEYLFLDEAFDGLDLGVRRMMRRMVRLYVRDRKACVILTSHNLQELEECVDRFGMIKDGKLICDRSVKDIREGGQSLEEYFLNEKEEKGDDWEDIFRKPDIPA